MLKTDNWETSTKRFVAFLDIMGFKDLISRKTHSEIYDLLNDLSKIIEKVNSPSETAVLTGKSAYCVNFSDSIIIFSQDDTMESLLTFTACVSYLFGGAIARSIPIKGAIAYGLVSLNETNQIYFGQPIIDAYLLQEEVYYYGVVLHHTVEKYLFDHQSLDSNPFFINFKTPLKSGLIDHLNLNWITGYGVAIEEIPGSPKILEKIEYFRTSVSGNPRIYIDNTISVITQKLLPPTSMQPSNAGHPG